MDNMLAKQKNKVQTRALRLIGPLLLLGLMIAAQIFLSRSLSLANPGIGAVMHLFNITEESNITGTSLSTKQPRLIFVDHRWEEVYVVAQHTVSIFNRNGILLRSFPVNISGPEDKKTVKSLVVDSQGIIYLLRIDEGVLHRFNQMGQYLGRLELSGLPAELAKPDLRSLAIDEQDRIYCLDQQSISCVCLGPGGRYQWHFPVHQNVEEKNKGKISNTIMQSRFADLVISKHGRIIISDNGKREIHIYDHQGKLLHAFGGSLGGVVKFSQLTGICVDENGRLYAVDTLSHNISIFSDQGEFLLQFGGFGLGKGWFSFPSDIAVLGQRIYVTDTNNNRIQVLEVASKEVVANLDHSSRRRLLAQDVEGDNEMGRRRFIPGEYSEGLKRDEGKRS